MVALAAVMITGCSETSAIPDGEQLFTGLKPIKYTDYTPCPHAEATKTELEAALASTPNGALFGSSYYRNPFPVGLWVWNAFAKDTTGLGHWLTRAFGTRPKLMSQVNPSLRALVAQGQLKKYGYFKGRVSYENITLHNKKKGKIAYTVDMGPLWTYDSIQYLHFPPAMDSLLVAHQSEAAIKPGDPFTVSGLDKERQRVATLMRSNGYYYYDKSAASYLADTLSEPGKAQMRLVMVDSLDDRVRRQWTIGRMNFNIRRSFLEPLNDSIVRRSYTARFNGRKSPVRMGVIRRNLGLTSGELYQVGHENKAKQHLQDLGLFSYSNMSFVPRDTTGLSDSLDVNTDLVLEKPYDFYINGNGKGKTTGRIGPEVIIGLTKNNAFRGGEKLDISLHGSYEWQTGHQSENSSTAVNSYEYGSDIALTLPRMLTPRSLLRFTQSRERRRRLREKRGGVPRKHFEYYQTPTTTIKASFNVINRAGYFRRHVISGELTYDWMPTAQSSFSFSPLNVSYEYMNSWTDKYAALEAENPYLQVSMADKFVPKMSFTYKYTSPSKDKNPVTVSATVSEAGNVLSAFKTMIGQSWTTKEKTLFHNPYAQFIKLETDWVKLWRLSEHSSLVAHANGGVIYSYGNSSVAPYYESFYVGGANSIRAFNVRSIGPGDFVPADKRYSYVSQIGDIKLLGNLEYRPRLWGDLYGAVFLDAGNVWTMPSGDVENTTSSDFQFNRFYKQMAVGTGVGLRYDMGMFVIRIDWGVGLHVPYDTGKSGFFNIGRFKDAQTLHLAVGYPF